MNGLAIPIRFLAIQRGDELEADGLVVHAITQSPGKVVSLFEPHSEIIRKGKARKPTEFGKLVQWGAADRDRGSTVAPARTRAPTGGGRGSTS